MQLRTISRGRQSNGIEDKQGVKISGSIDRWLCYPAGCLGFRIDGGSMKKYLKKLTKIFTPLFWVVILLFVFPLLLGVGMCLNYWVRYGRRGSLVGRTSDLHSEGHRFESGTLQVQNMETVKNIIPSKDANASFPTMEKLSDEQHKDHWVLSKEERKKKYVRPYRENYRHTTCGRITKMPAACAETYARNPKFYGKTFCCHCKKYETIDNFIWLDDSTRLGT